MTETVAVGFSPAAVPGPSLGASSASAKPAADGGLFAALLALLAPGAGSNPSDITLPDAVAAPFQGLAQAKDLLPKDLEAQLAATAGKLGIDLSGLGDLLADIDTSSETPVDPEAFAEAVTDLVEALAALGDAPAAAEAPEGADQGDLEAAVDALLALIGAPVPTPPPAPTTGETFTELVGELTEALTGPGAPSTDAPPPAIPASEDGGDVAAAPAQSSAAAPASAAPPTTDPVSAPAADDVRAPLVERLTQLLDDAAKAAVPTNPQLAEKLTALAKALPTLPDEVLTALEATATGAAEDAAPALVSLIDQAAKPRPAQRPPATSAFAAPRLDLPTAATDAGDAPVLETNPAPKAAVLAGADLESAPAAPASARADAPPPSATGGQQAPAAAPAEASPDKPVDTAPAAATAAQPLPTAAPAALRVVQAAYQQPPTPINLPQVAFEIVRQVEAGNSRFQIRLDPADLGRIDVQLDVDRSGNVNARMMVERPETLDLMQRDQRALQQALQQAGLDTSRTSLEFSLRQNPSGGDGFNEGRNQGQGGREAGGRLAADLGAEPITEHYRGSAAPGALNLFV